MSLRGLAGRSVIVTGGGSGIGLATVQRLRSEGAAVTAFDIDETALAALDDADVLTVAGDVSVPADIDRAFAEATERFGQVDGIFNNAAVIAPPVELADIDADELDRIFRVNVRGPFLGTQRLIWAARERGGDGVVLNTGSSLALVGSPRSGVYSAAKAAVLSLTRTAAKEASALGVRVNAILPGPIATPLLMTMPPEILEAAAAANPLGRFGQPDEVAALAAWLLSDESSYVTGGIYLVDGGEHA
jgi:NAD(P)-dependent dehydrogenase (short-subunit alcohol dehydrogenase family)